MCSLITALLSFLSGYILKAFSQRLSVINAFSLLLEKEITALAEVSDNLSGEYGISEWHRRSVRRIQAYVRMLDDKPYFREEDFKVALADYKYINESDIIRIGRSGVIDKLCKIYAAAKKLH